MRSMFLLPALISSHVAIMGRMHSREEMRGAKHVLSLVRISIRDTPHTFLVDAEGEWADLCFSDFSHCMAEGENGGYFNLDSFRNYGCVRPPYESMIIEGQKEGQAQSIFVRSEANSIFMYLFTQVKPGRSMKMFPSGLVMTLDQYGCVNNCVRVIYYLPEQLDHCEIVERCTNGLSALAIKLLSCVNAKNIIEEEIATHVINIKRKGRKPRKRTVILKTLRIDAPTIAKLASKYKCSEEEVGRRVHWVRGHTASYLPPNKPHVTLGKCQLWRHAHMRGNKEFGEVIKNYEVQCS